MTYWKSQEFKALQEVWYQRLRSSGFKDEETFKGDELVLKRKSYRRTNKEIREVRESYYKMLSQQVQEAEFKREIDQFILSWYADGYKIKVICEKLKEIGEYRCRTAIRFIVRRYEMAWGMRQYSPQQLNRKRKPAIES